ncbi:hypothetical protein PGT21_003438 [Puccinia graminis f. sp. tritici]|uniref:ADF-H domain-containing protein n=1 Tax=Puccinia graminis f. sp. tritici TaxID=56615 RepID=A0A5B0QZT0_PUCGR|nr:hypothetical protein PGT21_003438 [Puccinia graminis f. sp. tritici]
MNLDRVTRRVVRLESRHCPVYLNNTPARKDTYIQDEPSKPKHSTTPSRAYKMADVQDSTIQEAYDDVRNDKTSTNWLLLNYESERSDKLKLSATGSEGLNELKDKLEEDQASFVYARITYANDKESQRHKFILIIWIGPKVKVMRKANISFTRFQKETYDRHLFTF